MISQHKQLRLRLPVPWSRTPAVLEIYSMSALWGICVLALSLAVVAGVFSRLI
jgi:hypothetical protein